MMRPFGWRFNVFWQDTGGIGSDAGAVGNAGEDAANASSSVSGGLSPGVSATLGIANAPGAASSQGGAAVGSHGTQGAGPSGGGGGGGGGGGTAGGGGGGGTAGGGGPGGSAGGVGGGGHGVASTLAALLGQLRAGGQGPPAFSNLSVPPGVGGSGAAPTSPVTVSPLPSIAQTISGDPSVANSPLGQLALAVLGVQNPFGVSNPSSLGFPAQNPSIGVGGEPQGTPAPVGGSANVGTVANPFGVSDFGLGAPGANFGVTGAATTMGFPALSVNRGNFGQPAHGQPGNYGLGPSSNTAFGPADASSAVAAGMNPGMVALAEAASQPGSEVAQAGGQQSIAGQSIQGWAGVVQNHGPVTLQPGLVGDVVNQLTPNSPLMNELHNQGLDATVNPDGSVTLSPASQLISSNSNSLMSDLLGGLQGSPALSSLAGAMG